MPIRAVQLSQSHDRNLKGHASLEAMLAANCPNPQTCGCKIVEDATAPLPWGSAFWRILEDGKPDLVRQNWDSSG